MMRGHPQGRGSVPLDIALIVSFANYRTYRRVTNELSLDPIGKVVDAE
jgi:hypothetical protein